MPTVIVHIQGEEAVLGELDEIPNLNDNLIILKHPRKKDGKDLAYLDPNVNVVIWPMNKINFIEVLPAGEDDEIISFVRE